MGTLSKSISLEGKQLQGIAFALSILIYAFFSDPTPDSVGLPEVLMAALLVYASGILNTLSVFAGRFIFYEKKERALSIINISFLYYLIVPLIIGVINHWKPVDIIRDVIPLFFMFSFVFTTNCLLNSKYNWSNLLLPILISINGVLYSIRHFLDVGASLQDIGTGFYNAEFYFSTDPSVLFGGIYLPLEGFNKLYEKGLRKKLIGLMFILAGLICFGALILKGHRGPVGMMGITFFIYLLYNFKKPALLILSFLIVFASVYFFHENILSAFEILLKKNEQHGINGRDLEWLSAWSLISKNPLNFTFGIGWGSLFKNPASGGGFVNFAHWIVTYIFLKSGIVGVSLFALLFIAYVKKFLILFKQDLVTALACLGPLTIGLLINGSYRYFSFGIILTIIVLIRSHENKIKSIN